MKNHGGFDANAQTFRILTRLEKYRPNVGMNLTRRALLGVLKYPFLKNRSLETTTKFIFDEDKEAFTFVLDPFTDNDKRTFVLREKDNKLKNMSLDA